MVSPGEVKTKALLAFRQKGAECTSYFQFIGKSSYTMYFMCFTQSFFSHSNHQSLPIARDTLILVLVSLQQIFSEVSNCVLPYVTDFDRLDSWSWPKTANSLRWVQGKTLVGISALYFSFQGAEGEQAHTHGNTFHCKFLLLLLRTECQCARAEFVCYATQQIHNSLKNVHLRICVYMIDERPQDDSYKTGQAMLTIGQSSSRKNWDIVGHR